MQLAKATIFLGVILLFLAVLVGAFGAHALDALLEKNQRLGVFETASRYHFYHGFGLILLGMMIQLDVTLAYQKQLVIFMLFGTIIFSGSLYSLAIFNIAWFGAIAPVGGVLLLCAWVLLAYVIIAPFLSENSKRSGD